jgi:hypothetical protein
MEDSEIKEKEKIVDVHDQGLASNNSVSSIPRLGHCVTGDEAFNTTTGQWRI